MRHFLRKRPGKRLGKRLGRLTKSLGLALLLRLGLVSLAIAITYTFTALITVTESGGTAYSMLPMRVSMDVEYLADNGFMTASGLDTRVQVSETDVPHMLADDTLLFAYPVPANSTIPLSFYAGAPAISAFDIITGYNGYFTRTDYPSLEPGVATTPGDIGIAIENYSFGDGWSTQPKIDWVAGDVYVMWWHDDVSDGHATTISISAAGDIGAEIDTEIFTNVDAYYNVETVRIPGTNIWIVSGRTSAGPNGFITTIGVEDDGTITGVVDTWEYIQVSPGGIQYHHVAHVTENIFAVSFVTGAVSPYDHQIATFTVSDSGVITKSFIDSFNYLDSATISTAKISHASGDFYILTRLGYIYTVDIDSSGIIGGSVVDTLQFEATTATYSTTLSVDGEYYAVFYEGPSSDGWMATFTIDHSDGTIGDAVIESYEWDTSQGENPTPMRVAYSTNIFAVVYRSYHTPTNNHADIVTIEISDLGDITTPFLDKAQVNPTSFTGPAGFIQLSNQAVAVVYQQPAGATLYYLFTHEVDGDSGALDLRASGYFDTTTSSYIFRKDGAIVAYTDGTGNITADILGDYTWLTPTSTTDTGAGWNSDNNTWDDDTGTYADTVGDIGNSTYSEFLEMNYAGGVYTGIVRAWLSVDSGNVTTADIDAYYNATWNSVYEGAVTLGSFQSYSIGDDYQTITAIRIRMRDSLVGVVEGRINEVDFGEDLAQKTVSAVGVSSGEHIVRVLYETGADLKIYIDGVEEDSVALAGVTVPDTTTDWYFMEGNVSPYWDYYYHYVNSVLMLRYEPNAYIEGTALPDRAMNPLAEDAVITWGSNPAGLAVTISSLGSYFQPGISTGDTGETRDLLPDIGVSDWFQEPDVSGTLLTNPLRPFVTLLSDNTTLTERQSWILLALAVILLVTVTTARAVRGHYAITGFAAGAAIGAAVALTIFPLWSLIFVIGAIAGGLIAERSPSL